jgi:hypothetical protein
MDSLAEALPREQARVREVLKTYEETQRLCPHANCSFAMALIEDSLQNAERAAAAGDTVAMIQAYTELKGIE